MIIQQCVSMPRKWWNHITSPELSSGPQPYQKGPRWERWKSSLVHGLMPNNTSVFRSQPVCSYCACYSSRFNYLASGSRTNRRQTNRREQRTAASRHTIFWGMLCPAPSPPPLMDSHHHSLQHSSYNMMPSPFGSLALAFKPTPFLYLP